MCSRPYIKKNKNCPSIKSSMMQFRLMTHFTFICKNGLKFFIDQFLSHNDKKCGIQILGPQGTWSRESKYYTIKTMKYYFFGIELPKSSIDMIPTFLGRAGGTRVIWIHIITSFGIVLYPTFLFFYSVSFTKPSRDKFIPGLSPFSSRSSYPGHLQTSQETD